MTAPSSLSDSSIQEATFQFKAWDYRLINYYEKQINQLGVMIKRLKKAIRKSSLLPLPSRHRMIQQYKLLLQSQNQQLATKHIAHQKPLITCAGLICKKNKISLT